MQQVQLNIIVYYSIIFPLLKLVHCLSILYSCLLPPPQKLEVSIGFLVGDCLVAAAFLSYAGPFLSNYRDEMVQQTWLKQVSTQWCGHVVSLLLGL